MSKVKKYQWSKLAFSDFKKSNHSITQLEAVVKKRESLHDFRQKLERIETDLKQRMEKAIKNAKSKDWQQRHIEPEEA